MLSKILLVALIGLLISKLGLRTWFKRFKPRLDRAVNFTIAGLVIIYVGHATWWLIGNRSPETGAPATSSSAH